MSEQVKGTKEVMVRFPLEEKRRIEEAAKVEKRSVSNFIRTVVMERVQEMEQGQQNSK